MSRIITTEKAALGLEKYKLFLLNKNHVAARRASAVIVGSFNNLKLNPYIGLPCIDTDLRELIIEFGGAGYVVLYKYEKHQDNIYILAFRHQKEAGY